MTYNVFGGTLLDQSLSQLCDTRVRLSSLFHGLEPALLWNVDHTASVTCCCTFIMFSPVPNYAVWWQNHNGVNNLPRVVTQQCLTGCLTPLCYHLHILSVGTLCWNISVAQMISTVRQNCWHHCHRRRVHVGPRIPGVTDTRRRD